MKFSRVYRPIIYLIRLAIEGEWASVQSFLFLIYYKLRGVDLGYESVQSLGLSEEISNFYSNSGGPDLDICLQSLPINYNDSILDIGCGKGGALITLSKYPFQTVDGIDICDHLIAIAKKNVRKLNIEKIRLFCSNAATFNDLDQYTYIYIYNPFPCVIMKMVISNINKSLQAHLRQITIIYKNPVCHDIIVSNSNFRLVLEFNHSNLPFWIYKNTTAIEE